MKRNPKPSNIFLPREQKTAQELYEDTELIDAKALLWIVAVVAVVIIAAQFTKTPPRQSAPIETTVEDYR